MRSEDTKRQLLEWLRENCAKEMPESVDDWHDLGLLLLRSDEWQRGIGAIIISLEMRGMHDDSRVARHGVPNTRPYILTLDDIIDMQIKESIMARHEYEDAMYGTPEDYYRGRDYDDYYGGY